MPDEGPPEVVVVLLEVLEEPPPHAAAASPSEATSTVEAAHAEFAISGYHGATTARIATRAGISQSYVYALFPSKKDLFLACQRRNYQRILRILDGASAAGDPLQAQAMLRDQYLKRVQD